MTRLGFTFALLILIAAAFGASGGCNNNNKGTEVPPDIQAIFDKPFYDGAIWGLRVIDQDTGEVLINLRPDYDFFIGSVRKTFTLGELMIEVGPDHTTTTPIHYQGTIGEGGVLDGDLILVATGDLTMGGRTLPDGQIAISNFDHNEANSLGNAVLTTPNPIQGYIDLAEQVAAAGITHVTGDVVVDDRLFVPFPFRNEGNFAIRPIFVNDDCVDLIIDPTTAGNPASVEWRPVSAALDVESTLETTAAGTEFDVELDPEFPACIGTPGCTGEVSGQLPVDFVPPLTNAFPLIRTFRIVDPQNYARTVLIEQLEAAGVEVDADTVADNPVGILPPKDSYSDDTIVASLVSLTTAQHSKLIMKVSYNIGADTSLLLWGLTQGVDDMDASLAAERVNLTQNYGIPGDEFEFFDGSGGGDAFATNPAVTRWLHIMSQQPDFPSYFDTFPILAVDG
ncbi:MAG: D-alanyl-D-alanine carboxypeptidase, partial [Candidatus Dadabacteria bacterium]|nr:D-alanyl-D-alanine carboxypeptidase [Candidatus Dadabacteria bacterium]